jgi:hypothetical protein
MLAPIAGFTAGFLAASACIPVDRRPPFSGAAYRRDFDAVGAAGRGAPRGEGRYRAGWARAEIAPPAGVPLAGFGDREGAPSTGTRDPVHVRAFAIEAGEHRIILIAADLLELDAHAAEEVRIRLEGDIPRDHVFFTASHTHSGPGGYASGLVWELVTGPYDGDAFEAVVAAHVGAAQGALADLADVKIGTASVQVPGLIMNRTEKDGPVDDRLFLMRFEKKDRVAAFWAYGCHAVTLPAKNLLLSADYPGEVAGAFEGKTLDLLAFAAGGVGSANPRHEREDTSWIVDPLVRGVSRALALAAARSRSDGALASAQVTRPLPPLRYRVSDDVAVWGEIVAPLIDMPELSYGAVAIGDTVLLHLPSETSGMLTKTARARAGRSGVELAILPFNGTYVGYVTPSRIYDLPEEEGEELLYYETHTMTFLGPYGGDLMMNLGLRLASKVRARGRPVSDPGFF